MSYTEETPFDSLEGSHEYVAMLAEALAKPYERRITECDAKCQKPQSNGGFR